MGYSIGIDQVDAAGPKGLLRVQGLIGVWLAALRAWEKDESEDLSATMAALDRALDQADRVARWFGMAPKEDAAEPDPEPAPESPDEVI